MKNTLLVVFFVLIGVGTNVQAEQGCPPGQIPAQANGNISSCGPIPSGYYEQQEMPAPRPSGKWLKTWGAIASDGGDNLGVSKGKLKKTEAQEEALEKCRSASGKECTIDFTYENQCASIAEPYLGERAVTGMLAYARGPSKEVASSDVTSRCLKDNKGSECRVIYAACSEPIFKPY
ncbi:DUF4189 domain-containing protein [Xanthomonas prunicola]|uniref:DUF4189 domain-containing protein n=1 Tax=Xanthomonas prunicola TaxID=2053930 RepID=UPI002078B187|nr:DUF4189 domain-containing protein [Xanthomonas prunicola]USJ00315.1 DUF4189 domain-containing protein [Xanthomonas prunicola]UXA48863.1 DUF4189 domain-containing protein [Xanthomonas prunicola]